MPAQDAQTQSGVDGVQARGGEAVEEEVELGDKTREIEAKEGVVNGGSCSDQHANLGSLLNVGSAGPRSNLQPQYQRSLNVAAPVADQPQWDVTPPSKPPQYRPGNSNQNIVNHIQGNTNDRMSGSLPKMPAALYRQGVRRNMDAPKYPSQIVEEPKNVKQAVMALVPDEQRYLAHPYPDLVELTDPVQCTSCYLNHRRCLIERQNPRHCIYCQSSMHCTFRRVVVREGPAHTFMPSELIGNTHFPSYPRSEPRYSYH